MIQYISPHGIIQANPSKQLELNWNNHCYLFTELTMKLKVGQATQIYQTSDDFLEFFTGVIIINGEIEKNTPTFWVNFYGTPFDSTTPSTDLVLIGTMLHAVSHQVFSLKIRCGKVAFSTQTSVQTLWNLEKAYLIQDSSLRNSTNNYANRYQIPGFSPVPNVASISPNPQDFQQFGMNAQNYSQIFH